MVRADEETRSRLFWQQQETRRRYRLALERSFRGNAVSAKQLRDAWEPVVLARLEARITERNDEE